MEEEEEEIYLSQINREAKGTIQEEGYITRDGLVVGVVDLVGCFNGLHFLLEALQTSFQSTWVHEQGVETVYD